MIITLRLRLMTRHLGHRRLTLADTFMRFPLSQIGLRTALPQGARVAVASV